MVIFFIEVVLLKWGKEVKYYLGIIKEYVLLVCIRF